MNWQEILTLLVPILGMMAWVYNRIDKKLDRLSHDVNDINIRLTRLEGRFEERGYWESRWEPKVITKDENKP